MINYSDTHKAIQSWYLAHGRVDLPWRNTRDAYAIWLSEIMLQQTQVATVLARFYFPFLQRFPTLKVLADASEEEVLKAWEGLGYYSRARNLHKAAKMASPHLPCTVEGLLALPGIGRNTAHAVASFAFGLPVPVMEANVKRVLHRVFARERMRDAELWDAAEVLLDREDPFTHNQAMMDIGNYVCTSKQPKCLVCPLSAICEGKAAWERYPARKEKKVTPLRERIILVPVTPDGRYWLSPRETKLLGGLYGFPEFAKGEAITWKGQEVQALSLIPLGGVTWTYSHFKLQGEVYLLPVEPQGENSWYTREDITQLPLAGVDLKIVEMLPHDSALARKPSR
jgi:A/G-specific adenine glycosylase